MSSRAATTVWLARIRLEHRPTCSTGNRASARGPTRQSRRLPFLRWIPLVARRALSLRCGTAPRNKLGRSCRGTVRSAMRIVFRKLSDERHTLEIVREDGRREEVDCETRSLLVHDLLHLAVESEAKV